MYRVLDKKQIFVIEDSDEHFDAFEYACEKIGYKQNLIRFKTGDSAIQRMVHESVDLSDSIIFMDLNMPGMDGKDVIRTFRSSATTKNIPIIVFTTSNNPNDVNDCYAIGGNSYIQKPMELAELTKAIELVTTYWFGLSMLPSS